MADFISKIRIPKATEHFSTFNLGATHITTMDFFKIKPLYYRWLQPGQSINVDMSQTIRLAPLQKPFYGPVKLVTRAFWVPARLCMEGFNEFITDTIYTNKDFSGIISHVPTVSNYVIKQLMLHTAMSTATTESAYDFIDGDFVSGTKRILTNKGRYAMDILRCLGYQLDMRTVSEVNYNALPLLSFVKIYIDWFQNSNFSPFPNLEQLLFSPNKVLTFNDLFMLFDHVLYAPFENDYFTASWSNPASPYYASYSTVDIQDPTVSISGTEAKSQVLNSQINGNKGSLNGTPTISATGTTNAAAQNISIYILNALTALSDYMKRHQLSGYRAIDRFRSRWNITLPSAALNRCDYLGKHENGISITDVTSTADTEGAILGQYTGLGISRSSDNGGPAKFSYKADEFGMFIVLGIIVPVRAMYCNGIDRHLLDVNKLDLYTPEFDGLGCQAIANMELKGDENTSTDTTDPNGTWAWIPRYGHLKVAKDWLTGDFRNDSMNTNLNSFHTFRMFTSTPTHNVDFCTGSNTAYDRIFNETEDTFDHFYCSFNFNVTSKAPMSPLFENYHFDEAGNEVTMKVGGTKLS